MVIDEEVRAALDTLRRHAAGNDFELHRIDVLERDLTAPPVAEQIDENHQCFDGVIYYKVKDGHYRAAFSIHQAIWRYYNGDIPNGGTRYEIHHDDLNPENNTPSNLVLLTSSEHRKLHRALTPIISISPLVNFTCPNCGKEFTAPKTGGRRFCSEECHITWKINHPAMHTKTCPVCGKQFQGAKKKKYCSKDCANRSQAHYKTGVCLLCGKTFIGRPNAKYCSHKCTDKANHLKYLQRRKDLAAAQQT